jgi:hypothetical protein
VIPVAVALLLIACGLLYFFAVLKPRFDRRREAARKADIEAFELQQQRQTKPATVVDEPAPRALAEFVGGRDALAAEEERRQRRAAAAGGKAHVASSSREQKEHERAELQASIDRQQRAHKTKHSIVRPLGHSARPHDDFYADDQSTHSLSAAIDEVRDELDAVGKHGRFVEGKSRDVPEDVYRHYPELASMSAADTRQRHRDLKRELADLRAERDER